MLADDKLLANKWTLIQYKLRYKELLTLEEVFLLIAVIMGAFYVLERFVHERKRK